MHSTGYITGQGKCYSYSSSRSASADFNRVEKTGTSIPHGRSTIVSAEKVVLGELVTGAGDAFRKLNVSGPFKLAKGSKGRAYVGNGIADDVIDAKEIVFSDKIGASLNENIIHPPFRDYPSIDGITEITKAPLSYKQLTAENAGSAITANINDAYKSLRDNNIAAASGRVWKYGIKYERWEGVDLHVQYPFPDVSSEWVTGRMWPAFKRSTQKAFKNDGLIKNIYIHLHDGSVLKMDMNGL